MPGRLWQAIQDLADRCRRNGHFLDLCQEVIEARDDWKREVDTAKRRAFGFGVGLGVGLSVSLATVLLFLK